MCVKERDWKFVQSTENELTADTTASQEVPKMDSKQEQKPVGKGPTVIFSREYAGEGTGELFYTRHLWRGVPATGHHFRQEGKLVHVAVG